MSNPTTSQEHNLPAPTSASLERVQGIETQVNNLVESVTELKTLLQTALRVGANLPPAPAVPAPMPPAPVAAPQASAAPEAALQPALGFVPPASANAAAGASSSLLSRFPMVEAAVITAIITHEFRATDLYKLDPQYCNRSERCILALNGDMLELQSGDTTAKEYRSLTSIIIPLTVYFSILGAAIAPHTTQDLGLIHANFMAYIGSLHQFAAEYNWAAVSAYHVDFFTARRREMQYGDYSHWGYTDVNIQSNCLLGRIKGPRPSPTPQANVKPQKVGGTGYCMKYNSGQCPTNPCPWGRPHTCSSCGQGHPLTEHK